ncbi:LysR family transcriptional regulator [Cupriavidus sp. H18C1]|uniref:LysR family transcriptional regulator n=1 Tax=Cupriavidus sp. H18C1 TaxID=3241601 RepID=UPI003BB84AF5
MDSLDTLRIVLRVAELGGFARAADSLDLSKAAVSIAVQRLEASLGTQLFHRTTRRVQLTADGQAFYERARDLLDDMDELHGMFQRDGGALKGRLRVDMPAGMASMFVIPRLPEFLDRHPELSIEISGTDRRVDVVREGFDCVMRIGTLEDSSLVARPLGVVRLINCASPGYLRRHGTPRTIEDLRHHRLVHYASTLGQRPLGFEYPDGDGHAAMPMAGAVTVNNGAAYEAAAVAGLGIIQVPATAMQARLAAGELVEILPDFAPPPMPIALLYAQRRNLPRRVRVFMDWIAQILAPHLEPLP